ncbi:MAG: SAM-dependent methyltransferase [Microthrixaceae bacterium]
MAPGFDGVVLANELLDNLAFRLLVRGDDGWSEVYVEDGQPVIAEAPDDVAPAIDAPQGTRLPICEQASAWVGTAVDRLGRGRVLVIDYGVELTAELVGREWLRTYRSHDRGGDPFQAPGRTDITYDVPFDQLPSGANLVTQAEFLRRWGIDDLVDEGRRIWQERAHLGDLAAIRARSRVTEAEALLDEGGLGAFLVAEWTVS